MISTLGLNFWRSGASATRWLAGVVSLVVAAGCSTRRPCPLVVRNGCVEQPVAGWNSDSLDLRLLTFNIWGLPRFLTGAPANRYPRISTELERLQPDVVVLQEVWTDKARETLPHGPGWCSAWGACPRGFYAKNGLVTLSRHPIIGGQFFPFHKAALPDSLVRKGVLKTTIELPCGRWVNVWNVHLQAGNDSHVRLAQINELAAWVRAADDGQFADIVAGDFNSHPDSEEYRQLTQAVGPTIQAICHRPFFATFDGLSSKPGSLETLDHIFIRLRAESSRVSVRLRTTFTASNLKERLSDHFGLEGSLSFKLAPDFGPPRASNSLAAHAGTEAFR